MRHCLFLVLPALVIAWTVWGAAEYRRLKIALAEGRREALPREYRLTIAGELLFAALSLLAVGRAIFFASPAFHVVFPKDAALLVVPILVGMLAGVVVVLVLGRMGHTPPQIGDFAALMPQTRPERWLYLGVALSAGACEELLFRGFGLRLFASLGLTGYALLLVAALAFGLLHLYQGIAGMIGTFIIGLLLNVLFILTGSLLLPTLVHVLIDLRPLALPKAVSPSAPKPRGFF